MKKLVTLTLLLIFTLILGGCSTKEKPTTGNLKVNEENKSYIDVYEKNLQNYISSMTSILKTFNNSIDGLYTLDYSRGQFAQVIKDSIEKSNALVTDVESVDVKPELFEANQNLISLVNRSHQLLLTAIDMANKPDEDIDKEYLRTEYMDIKVKQAEISNQWKILREQLEAEQGAAN